MKPKDCTTKRKKFVHLSERDRYKIEGLLEGKKEVEEIAVILGRDRSTIYREIIRGTIVRVQNDFCEEGEYRANSAQADYDAQGKNKERSLKIGKDKENILYCKYVFTIQAKIFYLTKKKNVFSKFSF